MSNDELDAEKNTIDKSDKQKPKKFCPDIPFFSAELRSTLRFLLNPHNFTDQKEEQPFPYVPLPPHQ